MISRGSCRSCSKVHEENACTCGHEYHGHGHGLDFGLQGCLNCRCRRYIPDGEVCWTTISAPQERPSVPRQDSEGDVPLAEDIMRRVRGLTLHERAPVAMGLARDLEVINVKLRKRRSESR